MAERIPESLQKKIEARLRYHEDLGIRLFYRERAAAWNSDASSAALSMSTSPIPVVEESSLPKSAPKPKLEPEKTSTPLRDILPPPTGPSLFESVNKVEGDTLLKIREDIGDCTRCKLHKG